MFGAIIGFVVESEAREEGPDDPGSSHPDVVGLENSGFTFNNPNAASKCSCGKSFG